MFQNNYYGKRIFLTGHTGFKGSWLTLWLNKLGAEVKGYSLAPEGSPNHYDLLQLDVESTIADIRNLDLLKKEIIAFKPDIVFHMAAQPLVRYSYDKPVETYDINVMGTVKLLEACRFCDSIKAIVNITTDKCYENREWVWGYREDDPMGGYDPYSSSKGCAELVISAYRNSFYNLDDYGNKHNTLVASVRAGNVIGGGDWAQDRLVPDIMRSAANNEVASIRSPFSTRPWEHVLEPLSGYLLLGQHLLEKKVKFVGAWNFGPGDEGVVCVQDVITQMQKSWDSIKFEIENSNISKPHEANLLKLDCSKAHFELNWTNTWSMSKTFAKTVEWYKEYYESGNVISAIQLEEYEKDYNVKMV